MERHRILPHRGLWMHPDEKNTFASLKSALDKGYGLETDIRDRLGEIVISHDPPNEKSLLFESFLDLLRSQPSKYTGCIALNVKSDGLERRCIELLESYGVVGRCFVFDMSAPSKYLFHKELARTGSKLRIATRISDIEAPVLYEKSEIIWMDGFETDWFGAADIEEQLGNGKTIAIVSPELHGRPYIAKWKEFKPFFTKSNNVLICTDKPEEFERFVGE
jgi:hypothetical protein